MAPTRYGQALDARDAVQGYGTSSNDDGSYHPSNYHAGEQGQYSADDGSYAAQNKGTRQDSSLDTAPQGTRGSQQSQVYQQGQQNTGSQNTGSQNTGSQNTGSQYGGSQSTRPQSGSQNTGPYQQSSNAQNAAQQQSQQGTSNTGYSQSAQGIGQVQPAYAGTANTNAQQQSSWSQQNAQSSQPQQNQQSQQNPSNANLEQWSYGGNRQLAESNHQQQNNAADLSNNHVSDQHQTDTTQQDRRPNLVNNHVSPPETLQTTPTLTTATMDPTSSLTTSPTTTESPHTSVPTTSATSSATSSPTAEAAKNPDIGAYHKATWGLTAAVGVALIAGLLVFCIARRKRQKRGEANRPKMVREALRQYYNTTKQRTSQIYTSVVGTAAGTSASALGAVRRSLASAKFSHQQSEKAPMPQQGHDHHPCEGDRDIHDHSGDGSSGPGSYGNDSIAAEKAAINESTPTLVVSPTESIGRDLAPTVRRVISGRPQMESSDSVEPTSGIASHAPDNDADKTGKSGEYNGGTTTRAGQNLLTITSIMPTTSSVYRVDIPCSSNKPEQVELREGQHIMIRQSFDDGWVLCAPADGGPEGLAPRACLSPWPVKTVSAPNSSNNSSDGSRTPDSPSVPGTPRFYSHFNSSRNITQ